MMVVNHRLSIVNNNTRENEEERDCSGSSSNRRRRRRNAASSWMPYGCHCGSVRWRVSTTSGSLFSFFLLLVSVETLSLATVTTATRMHYIHWNTTNPIFRIDNTDHIIDVNKNNIPFEYDQVNIICPVYTPGTHDDDAEKYIIYNVSKEEYDTCRITNPNPRIIAVCDKPHKLMYFTITFRSFTPQPGGLEFRPGQDYYFISTSSKEDLHRRIGGRCSSHNMKVVFKVCCKSEDLDKGTASNVMGRPALSSSTTTTTTMASATSTHHGPVVILANSNRTNGAVIPASGSPSSSSSSAGGGGGGGANAVSVVALSPAPAAAVIPAVRGTATTTVTTATGGSLPTTTTPGTPQLILPSVPALSLPLPPPPPPPQQRIPPHWKDMADGVPSFNVRTTATTTTKKYGKYDFDKLSNEVVKNEELTSKSSGALQRHSSSSCSAPLVLIFSAALNLFVRVR